jgi:beta-glucanase (GH16 family)
MTDGLPRAKDGMLGPKELPMPKSTCALFFVLVAGTLGACASNGAGSTGTGGAHGSGSGGSGSGGTPASGGTPGSGGTTASGGVTGSGGNSSSGTGGGLASGGSSASGGTSASGGQPASGGSSASGGAGGRASGGSSEGGRQGAGGRGGPQGSGGAAGGATGTGGAVAVGAKCPSATWNLVWGDDFDGASGAAVDGSKWAYDTGPNWFNNELQDYTSGATNASLDGSGNLIIEARMEAREGRQYTSARLKTEGKKTFTYGRIEGRMKLPAGQGMWPAFWMLGGSTWPDNGEIDIMENLGKEPSIAHGTMHGPGYSGAAGPTAMFTLPGGAKFSDGFHIFAIEWEASAIRWYVDDQLYSTKTTADTKGGTWVFDHGFFLILNLAVGGDWPGNPDATTSFPQKMVIDYVRVCQK